MKAAQISEYGEIDVIHVTSDASKPILTDDQVLIEVHASNINPFDWKVRKGFMHQMKPLEFPATLGGDLAGVVVEVGKNVSNFSVGDKVYGSANIFGGGSGAFAEYAVTKPESLAKMPEGLDFTEAASLPLTGASAVQALIGHIKLQSGQKILIHGGAGGIGTMAIQIAKHTGAYVATTVSKNSIEYVKQLGADEVIDYKNQKFEELLSGFDAVFDTVGQETYDKSFLVLKKGGIIVSMVQPPKEDLAKKYEVTAIIQGTKVGEWLEKLTELVNKGIVKPHVDSVFPLDQIHDAFRAQEEGSPQGKVIVKIR
jgi:alcohol dehydrogenase